MNEIELKREKVKVGMEPNVSKEEIIQLNNGIPIQKIIGKYINMYDIEIDTSFNVLMPRYETDELISLFIKNIKPNDKVLDLCSGSGVIGLSIKKCVPLANVDCADISQEAINAIKQNSKINNLEVNVIKSDLFNNLKDKYDFIICNPPYIPTSKINSLLLDHEPLLALDGGSDGNKLFKRIFNDFTSHLNKGGEMWFEIMYSNADYLKKQKCTIIDDINKKNRFAYYKM